MDPGHLKSGDVACFNPLIPLLQRKPGLGALYTAGTAAVETSVEVPWGGGLGGQKLPCAPAIPLLRAYPKT